MKKLLLLVMGLLVLVACGNKEVEQDWSEKSERITASTQTEDTTVQTTASTVTTQATTVKATTTPVGQETEKASITEEQASRKVLSLLGDRDEETGFEFTAGCEERRATYNGKEYYAVRVSWLVEDEGGNVTHSSYVGNYFVAVDGGKMYHGYRSGNDYIFEEEVS